MRETEIKDCRVKAWQFLFVDFDLKMNIFTVMKNISFITDKTTKTRYAQINLKKVAKYTDEELEDLLDVIVAEARRDDEKITIEELEKQLKKAKKL